MSALLCIGPFPSFFFRVPKSGNTFITQVLATALDGRQGTASASKSAFAPASTLTADEVAQRSSRFYNFTFVRNPFTRIASAYLEKICMNKPPKRLVSNHFGRRFEEPISFDEFCDYLAAGGCMENMHWAPQVHACPVAVEELDFVGRLENVNNDLATVLDAIGIRFPDGFTDRSGHGTQATDRASSLFTQTTVASVLKTYADDFQRLGYADTPPWA